MSTNLGVRVVVNRKTQSAVKTEDANSLTVPPLVSLHSETTIGLCMLIEQL